IYLCLLFEEFLICFEFKDNEMKFIFVLLIFLPKPLTSKPFALSRSHFIDFCNKFSVLNCILQYTQFFWRKAERKSKKLRIVKYRYRVICSEFLIDCKLSPVKLEMAEGTCIDNTIHLCLLNAGKFML